MQSEKAKDVLLGLAVVAFAVGGFLFVNPTGAPVMEGPGGITWRTLPFIYSGLLLVLAVLFVAITLLRGPLPTAPGSSDAASETTEDPGDAAPEKESPASLAHWLPALRRLAVVAILVVYSQALGAFGFAITTPVFLYSLLYVFGRTHARENALISLIGGFVLWVLFAYLLKMPLEGDLWDPVTPALTATARMVGL